MELSHIELKDRVYDFVAGTVKNSRPVVVDLYTDWCSACKMMSPGLDLLGEKLMDSVDIVKVNITKADDLVNALQIQSVPTLLFLKPGSTGPVKTVVGAYPPNKVEEDIIKHLLA